ncbi:uncharacterized protein LOC133298764 [Gastrolobium bilobum]|uniref:uncharacterized protein LOC133298764 n=1 Tax=Gastrolobium bilobum TaxID=150636 RepID=UPI002AB01B12|nr:uncharacterized protein LOC133298764 [Gastrolobium bilobum]
MGIPDRFQDTHWHVSVSNVVRESLSLAGRDGTQGVVGCQELDELDEFRLSAYESASLYKEKTKKWHDRKILSRDFKVGQQVLLYNSRLRLFPGKLKSRWSGPFLVKEIRPYGTVEISPLDSDRSFKVNGQRLKPYLGGEIDRGTATVALAET